MVQNQCNTFYIDKWSTWRQTIVIHDTRLLTSLVAHIFGNAICIVQCLLFWNDLFSEGVNDNPMLAQILQY